MNTNSPKQTVENTIHNAPISSLKGVGAKRAQLYQKLGISYVKDLINHYPRDYRDFSKPVEIFDAALDEYAVIKAEVINKRGEQLIRKGLSIFKVTVSDDSGILVITIFNSVYLFDGLKMGKSYYFYGRVTGDLLRREMTSPIYLEADEEALLRPIYSLTEGLSGKMVQTNVKDALLLYKDSIGEPLPSPLLLAEGLCQKVYAIENIHFPKNADALEEARRRLIFEELFIFQLGLQRLSSKNRHLTSIVLKDIDISPYEQALPFTLTDGQRKVIVSAADDMSSSSNVSHSGNSVGIESMNRLLQGDVGSGKTAVAAALCYLCSKNGYQSAVMAPTQILADQHYNTFLRLLSPLSIKVCLLTGGQTPKQRGLLLEGIKSGEYSVVIGTHALISRSVEFNSLGLVVTDEQHRFGVAARSALAQKGDNPHLLVMSATPIPRTLALLIYGDLQISIIPELPSGRQPIDTLVINSKKRARALGFMRDRLDEGRQAYIVCPLIEESDSELLSIKEYLAALKQSPLASYSTGLLHGRLSSKEKEELMRGFVSGEIKLLISTTVVEVGVDVPNATVMLIENAERFGLSQLHQLRGRVGRGEHKSYCILVSDHQGEESRLRLNIMKTQSDGFKIAEEDLKLRGPGDFFGQRQHGLPTLKLAGLYNDMELLERARDAACELLERDPELSLDENAELREAVEGLFEINGEASLN